MVYKPAGELGNAFPYFTARIGKGTQHTTDKYHAYFAVHPIVDH